MTDRPIIFSAPMVRALLAGRKTMTRRVLKPQPVPFKREDGSWSEVGCLHVEGDKRPRLTVGRVIMEQYIPYAVGDRLWVRESLYRDRMENFLTGERTTNSEVSYYTADNAEAVDRLGFNLAWKWKRGKLSARYCPMEFARPWRLVVTAVRVERLQEISEEDAEAEGCVSDTRDNNGNVWHDPDARAFARLWDSLHGHGAWDANPWVAVISFKTEAHP